MNAVGSYSTFSPLPCGQRTPIGRSVFCGTGRHRFGWTPIHRWTTKSCPGVTWQLVHGARTFLASATSALPRPSGQLWILRPKCTIQSSVSWS